MFIHHNHMIKTVSSDWSDYSLRKSILPWTFRGGQYLMDPHIFQTLTKYVAIDSIPVSNQMLWSCIPWEGFNDLSARPLCSRICSWIKMEDFPSAVLEDYQDKQNLECHSWDCEKIDRDGVMQVVFQKRFPCLRWRPTSQRSYEVWNGPFRYFYPEFE